MPDSVDAIRGMNDVLPDKTPLWQRLEQIARTMLESYGYEEIRLPLLEKTALFARSLGEFTDIVQKEMYTFVDRSGDSVTLRPDGTASCVRAALKAGLFYKQPRRLWYKGPMFRHERPQKGRYRQFHQIGVEAFGMPGPDIDAELILMSARTFQALQLTELKLEINSLGTSTSRAAYRERLVEYFSRHLRVLDEDSQRRLKSNPLRILDSKDPTMQRVIAGAPTIHSYLDHESAEHFEGLRLLLDEAAIAYTVNSRLVRGLDYYNRTVFEWVTKNLGSQGTVCAGGRYDGLVEHFGGKATPAVGYAMGIERLVALIEDKHSGQFRSQTPHAYVISVRNGAINPGLQLAEWLRDILPGLRLLTDCVGGSFKNQFQRADKSRAVLALVLGEEEIAGSTVSIKHLRKDKPQVTLTRSELVNYLRQELGETHFPSGLPL
ncbi:MAG: histidine--tRNA ligase [Gammaproteobacteria bacterium]|nr:histidine--tRNA ligase [Gammaproteobacteria bacterium]MCI0591104.1 histidine--tRNA ligase [Gammaproteobacteria bacterium]